MKSKIFRLLNAVLISCVLAVPLAQAHSPLKYSAPENGETLTTSPAEIKLEFKKQVKLVLVRLKGDKTDQKLRPDSQAESQKHALLLPKLSDGSYTAAWRAIGADGHIMKGVIKFSIHP